MFVTALSRSEYPVRFDPAEPTLAVGQCYANGSTGYIKLSSSLRPGLPGEKGLVVPIFEAFNVQNQPHCETLRSRARAGRISRDDYVVAKAALEQLAHAEMLWVLRQHFGELSGAGMAASADLWQIPSFDLGVPATPGRHVPVRGYPHGIYGTGHDRLRFSIESRPDGDLWEAAVLLDRIWFHNQIMPGDREDLLGAGRHLDRIDRGDPWFLLHRNLPRPVRVWLSTVRGGEHFAAACRAGWIAAGAVAAAVP